MVLLCNDITVTPERLKRLELLQVYHGFYGYRAITLLERRIESSWTQRLMISTATSFAPGLGTQRGSSNCTSTEGRRKYNDQWGRQGASGAQNECDIVV